MPPERREPFSPPEIQLGQTYAFREFRDYFSFFTPPDPEALHSTYLVLKVKSGLSTRLVTVNCIWDTDMGTARKGRSGNIVVWDGNEISIIQKNEIENLEKTINLGGRQRLYSTNMTKEKSKTSPEKWRIDFTFGDTQISGTFRKPQIALVDMLISGFEDEFVVRDGKSSEPQVVNGIFTLDPTLSDVSFSFHEEEFS